MSRVHKGKEHRNKLLNKRNIRKSTHSSARGTLLGIKNAILSMALVLLLITGCSLQLEPPPVGSQGSNATGSKPGTDAGINPSTIPGTLPDTQGSTGIEPGTTGPAVTDAGTRPKRTGELALEQYLEGRSALTSETIIHIWSVESSYPMKTGENTLQWNYDIKGEPASGRGSIVERYLGKEAVTSWTLSPLDFTVISDGETQVYTLEEVAKNGGYDFDGLMAAVLPNYPVRLDENFYHMRTSTSETEEIRKYLEYLGYDKPAEDYQGNLFLEITLSSVTGYLETINYSFDNSMKGFTDNGQVTFSGWNTPVSFEMETESPLDPEDPADPDDPDDPADPDDGITAP